MAIEYRFSNYTRSLLSKKNSIIIVTCLLFLHFLLTLYCIQANSPTCDEVAHHVASGFSYLKTHDFRMNPANPPLIRAISALPLLFLNLKMPFENKSWEEGNSPVFGNEFFYKLNTNSETIIFWARVPIALLSVVLGVFVFLWSFQLFGINAGILSLGCYVFSPNIMAFAGIASVDLGASLFIFISFFSFYLYLEKPSKKRLLLAGICFGLAQAAKFTSIVLIPIFATLFSIHFLTLQKKEKKLSFQGIAKLFGRLFFLYAIGYLVVYGVGYFFETKPLLQNAPDIQEKINYIGSFVDAFSLSRFGLTKEVAVHIATKIPIPLSAYLVGLLGVIHQGAVGLDTFLLGVHSKTGFWNYFLVAWFTKTTLPVLILFFVSLFLMVNRRNDLYKKVFLLLPMVIFFILISRSNVQVGLRHLLPMYPLLFVFIGQVALIKMREMARNVFLACFISWQFFSLITAYPFPIAYFNEIVGGPKNGYRILRDSNLDWGQGLKSLARYLKENRIERVKLYYFGTADPEYYKIPCEQISPDEFIRPKKGIYAVSAQYLDAFSWTEAAEPSEKVAYSIFIYKF